MDNENVDGTLLKENRSTDFEYLPDYAAYLLHYEFDHFVNELLRLYRGADVPILRFFKDVSLDRIAAIVTASNREMLTLLASHQVRHYIQQTLDSWIRNQIPIITREQVHSNDIMLINFAQAKAFRQFIPNYTDSIKVFAQLADEIDRFFLILNSELFSTYLDLQQAEINSVNVALEKREKQLLEAQEIGQVGSFEWEFGGRSTYTPQMYKTVAGEAKILRGKGEVVADEHGKAVMLLGTCQDVTNEFMLTRQLRERERYLQELNRSLELTNQELSRKNEELESFNFIASHDLQEPLRKIQVYSNRIAETGMINLAPSVREDFGRINAASKRMQKLIEDFLLFSQASSANQPKELVDLHSAVEEVKTDLVARIEEKNALISVSPLPKVYGVPFQIKQLLVNLVSNSLKYTHGDVRPQITISGGIVDGSQIHGATADPRMLYAMVSVADNGIGFDPKYQEKIFEIFQRLHSKNVYSGTGIGLALCKKIVQNLNGFIKAESAPGQGAVFTFYLPAKKPESIV